MVFYANHGLAARQCGKRGANRGDSFDQARMHTAVDDSISLVMVRCDLKLGNQPHRRWQRRNECPWRGSSR